jgi:hypothetical protein
MSKDTSATIIIIAFLAFIAVMYALLGHFLGCSAGPTCK